MSHKLPLGVRVRMWKDYFKYLIFLQQEESVRLTLGVIIFISSVYLLEHELTSKFSDSHGENAISLIIILIIIKFIWEAFNTQSEIRSYFHIQRSILRNNLSKPLVRPGDKEKEAGFMPLEIPGNKSDLIFTSEKVSRYIQTTPLTITLSETKTLQIRKYIQKHREILLQYLNHYFFNSLHANRQFTNDKKLCLSRDISLNSKHIYCHPGGYYDSFVTNQVSGTTLIIKDKLHTTITTEHIFPSREDEAGTRYLSDISSSQMNDHLGCSTLGFTADNYLLIWTQGGIAQFSKDLLIPTGSGSSNFSDIEHHNLQKTIIKTMERELTEETTADKSLDPNLNRTMILGFYRWVTRGGKPEFTGITKLPGTADQYRPDPKEARTDKSASLKFKVETIEDLPKVIESIKARDHLSTPLYMCLYQLEEMSKNHKEELKVFLFD
jgi:hypothetical protein